MALETATYIDGLVVTNPVGASDNVSTADDHLRLIKSTVKATFPNLTGAVTATQTELNYCDGATGVTGTGDMVRSASPTLTGTAIIEGATFSAIPTFSSAGAFPHFGSATQSGGAITVSTSDASGTPAAGDLWIKYTA